MAEEDMTSIQVCVRVRPLNQRELQEGNRVCVHFDEPTRQVVLTAVDKNTLLQLKGQTARGYAFDRRYSIDNTSDDIYDDCVSKLVENCFKGYNATVLAYGQTGSGKTHTMSGGVGIHGLREEGITPRVIRHMFAIIAQLRRRMKPGEELNVTASAVEIYNEDLRDLSKAGADAGRGWDGAPSSRAAPLKITEKPLRNGRIVAEIQGLQESCCENADELLAFFDDCMSNRSISSTKLNDRSSRSHAIFTISLHRVVVTVSNSVDPETMRAVVHTEAVNSKLHLVDLAGSERVKRSGVTGKELKEATHINSGLLALGNVIVALAECSNHVPYRDSKLTRILQDSLGGNSLTVLVTCISPSEADFEETNNTLKYSNRACHIKNTPLPNKYLMLEEDLLPVAPGAKDGQVSGISLTSLLEDHLRQKEFRERREREKQEKEKKRQEQLKKAKQSLMSTPGYQRVLAQEYDRKLKMAKAQGKRHFALNETIDGTVLRDSRRKPGTVTTGGFSFDQFLEEQGLDEALAGAELDGGKARLAMMEGKPGAGWEGGDGERGEDGEATLPGQQHEPQEEEEEEEEDVPAWVQRRRQLAAAAAAAAGSDADQASPRDAGVEPPDASSAHAAAAAAAAQIDNGESMRHLDRQEMREAAGVGLERGEEQAAELGMEEEEEAEDGLLEEEEEEEEEEDVGEEDREVPLPPRVTMENLHRFMPLARFKINKHDTISVFKAQTKEDFQDVVKLLPENTPLPASDKMTYLIARLECTPNVAEGLRIQDRLQLVAEAACSMEDAVGPAVGCLMATFGTNMISSCIFDFDENEELEKYGVQDRIELWGLQIPHNSVRPTLKEQDAEDEEEEKVIRWTSIDRLNMSVGLLYALCSHAEQSEIRCGFCVPRPQLLRRWKQAGVRMKQVESELRLIYPPHAHDYEYYKSSTVAYFFVDEIQEGLRKVLSLST